VTTTPGANHEAVADHALALMLAVLRRIVENDAHVRGGGWRTPELFPWQLAGATVGLVGVGLIGSAVARRLAGFGARLLAHDPYATEVLGGELVPLDELLAESDVVSIHCPLSPETHGLLSRERIARLKPSAVVVNTARGPIVDEAALVDALAEGRIRGAGLDVFLDEPPPSEVLRSLPNVVLSPHHGGLSDVSNEEMCRRATRAVLAVLRGEPPEGLVNPAALVPR
jgi:glyoxylate reductase